MTHDQHNAWPAPQWHHGFKQCKCPFQPWTSIHAIVYLIRNGNGWLCLRKERIPEQLCKFKPLKKCLRRDPGKWNLASIEKHLQHSFSFFRYRPLQQFKQQLLQCCLYSAISSRFFIFPHLLQHCCSSVLKVKAYLTVSHSIPFLILWYSMFSPRMLTYLGYHLNTNPRNSFVRKEQDQTLT